MNLINYLKFINVVKNSNIGLFCGFLEKFLKKFKKVLVLFCGYGIINGH